MGGLAIAGLGLAFGWNWLAAVGALPILLSTLPCMIMMGICMKNMKSCTHKAQPSETQERNATGTPVSLPAPSQHRIEETHHA